MNELCGQSLATKKSRPFCQRLLYFARKTTIYLSLLFSAKQLLQIIQFTTKTYCFWLFFDANKIVPIEFLHFFLLLGKNLFYVTLPLQIRKPAQVIGDHVVVFAAWKCSRKDTRFVEDSIDQLNRCVEKRDIAYSGSE